MTQKEILTALLEGKKIRQKDWEINTYIHLVGDKLLDEDGEVYPNIWFGYDWEICIKTVTFFEALQAMKEGKICKNMDTNRPVYFNKVGELVFFGSGANYIIDTIDLDCRWQILEGDANGIN
jgi:hypothetical protein